MNWTLEEQHRDFFSGLEFIDSVSRPPNKILLGFRRFIRTVGHYTKNNPLGMTSI
jgi:hypothetical protein